VLDVVLLTKHKDNLSDRELNASSNNSYFWRFKKNSNHSNSQEIRKFEILLHWSSCQLTRWESDCPFVWTINLNNNDVLEVNVTAIKLKTQNIPWIICCHLLRCLIV